MASACMACVVALPTSLCAPCPAWRAAGVGGTRAVPVSSSDTRNVMEAADDPYREESVLVRTLGVQRCTALGFHTGFCCASGCIYSCCGCSLCKSDKWTARICFPHLRKVSA